jgi:hypothetical protein
MDIRLTRSLKFRLPSLCDAAGMLEHHNANGPWLTKDQGVWFVVEPSRH